MFPHQESCGARGKRKGLSPGATERHSHSTRVPTESRQKHFFRKNIRLSLLTLMPEFDKCSKEADTRIKWTKMPSQNKRLQKEMGTKKQFIEKLELGRAASGRKTVLDQGT